MAAKLNDKQIAAVMMHRAAISVIEATSYLAVADAALTAIIEDDHGPDEGPSKDAAAAAGVLRILDEWEPLLRTSTIAMMDVVFGEPFSRAFFQEAIEQVNEDRADAITAIFADLLAAPSCLPVFSDGSFEITLDDDEPEQECVDVAEARRP